MSKQQKFIDAYAWQFGCTKREAMIAYRDAKRENNEERINIIIGSFNDNAKKSFYED